MCRGWQDYRSCVAAQDLGADVPGQCLGSLWADGPGSAEASSAGLQRAEPRALGTARSMNFLAAALLLALDRSEEKRLLGARLPHR